MRRTESDAEFQSPAEQDDDRAHGKPRRRAQQGVVKRLGEGGFRICIHILSLPYSSACATGANRAPTKAARSAGDNRT